VLVGRAVLGGKGVLPERRVGFDDGRLPRGDRPTVEWPEVQATAELLAQVQQPRYAGMVDLATEPWTSKWNTDLAEPARCSVIRRQRMLPVRAVPLPARPSRTKST